ncbi:sensor histidine kinase [Chitinophaga horti]|uniref:histidine kinase n=1 Tax=Chitinophaga horti TaxID=2920382 RepID=A0ABY6J2D1_9BACT|nr:sensor histidine kinase [Chitinophaga horti]UYQ93815.1 sensor histidine kinase [Chitinophaga horti]
MKQLLLSVCFIIVLSNSTAGQSVGWLMKGFPANHIYKPPDTATALRMIKLASACLFKAGELAVDLDSAAVLLRNARKVFEAVNYTPGLNLVRPIEINLAREQLNFPMLKTFFSGTDIQEKIMVSKLLTWAYWDQHKKDSISADSALLYAKMMERLAVENRFPAMANEAQYYIARSYLAMGNLTQFKVHMLVMAKYHADRNELRSELDVWGVLNSFLKNRDTVAPSRFEVNQRRLILARKLGIREIEVDALFRLGEQYSQRGRRTEAEKVLMEAYEKHVPAGPVKLYSILDLLTRLHQSGGNADKAIHYAWATLESAIKATDNKLTHDNYRLRLGEVLTNFGRNELFYEMMSDYIEGTPEQQATSWFYILNHAAGLLYRKNPAKALAYLQDRQTNLPAHPFYRALANKMAGQISLDLKNVAGARKYMLAALADSSALYANSSSYLLADIYLYLAQMAGMEQQYDEVLKYIEHADRVPKSLVPLSRELASEHMRFKVDSIRGNFDGALLHHIRFKMLSDSINNLEKIGQMEELNIRYKTAEQNRTLGERAREIAWLTNETRLRDSLLYATKFNAAREDTFQLQRIDAANQLARLRGDSLHNSQEVNRFLSSKWDLQNDLLEQTRRTHNLTVTGAVLLALLLLLGYNRYRLKQRSNRQLQMQQKVIQTKNQSLEKLVTEKEWLLKEVHHRVKNNLQVVASLLNIQSFYLRDDSAISAIRDSQRRVNAISLIHKKLYQSDNSAMINMPQYIKELLSCLYEYSEGERDIQFRTDVADVTLSIREALPIGLILNEAVTNAFKYAFEKSGIITITLKPEEEGSMLLSIADNGRGLTIEVGEDTPPSLGISLMQGLAKDLEGEFQMLDRNGTTIIVRFPLEVLIT